ncbi:MAG: hypothetical protein ACKVQQ_20700 [Burkholderiales bacterium]
MAQDSGQAEKREKSSRRASLYFHASGGIAVTAAPVDIADSKDAISPQKETP